MGGLRGPSAAGWGVARVSAPHRRAVDGLARTLPCFLLIHGRNVAPGRGFLAQRFP